MHKLLPVAHNVTETPERGTHEETRHKYLAEIISSVIR